jgi:hypothetical protein
LAASIGRLHAAVSPAPTFLARLYRPAN